MTIIRVRGNDFADNGNRTRTTDKRGIPRRRSRKGVMDSGDVHRSGTETIFNAAVNEAPGLRESVARFIVLVENIVNTDIDVHSVFI